MKYSDVDQAIVHQYQKLVDKFHLPRMKLIEWCASGYSGLGLPAVFFGDLPLAMNALSVICYIAVTYFCILDSKRLVPNVENHKFMRTFFLAIMLFNLVTIMLSGPEIKRILYLLSDIAIYSAYALCDCKDPPPPRKKTVPKLSLST